ncbi:hypothetical protein [Allobaculum sp. Allo2]|nr:hypothetical protein [Allobaculum sp. Allo2]
MLQAYRLRFLQPYTRKPIEVELDMDTRFKWFDPALARKSDN